MRRGMVLPSTQFIPAHTTLFDSPCSFQGHYAVHHLAQTTILLFHDRDVVVCVPLVGVVQSVLSDLHRAVPLFII